MKRTAIGIGLVLAALSGAVLAAQLYRWVDEKGNVEWRDTPPPPSAKKFEQRNVGGGSRETSPMPYSLQVATKNFPVVLWSANCGAACDQAKALLAKRGIPYIDKDPQEDFQAFQKATGGTEIPVLFVGSTRLRGYLDTDWHTALDAAGYPKTPQPGVAKPVPKPVVTPVASEGQLEGTPPAPAQ
jgi:hypothetical protein